MINVKKQLETRLKTPSSHSERELKSFSKSQFQLHKVASIASSIFAIAAVSFFGISSASAAGNSVPANALPTGGQVVAGQAAISQSNNVMNINQSSQRGVINWDSFNVGSNATVNFNQPNASSSTLNRVNGATQSMINGAVNANGQVIFVNPNGVIFGKGAEVNTGGITATTMNISDSDYMNGKMNFTGNGTGTVSYTHLTLPTIYSV